MSELLRDLSFLLLPLALFIGAFVALGFQVTVKDPLTARRLQGLSGALTMAALVSMQLRTNIRAEGEIREQVAALSAARPAPSDARAHAVQQSVAQLRLNTIVREADRMGPWLLTFASVLMGANLGLILSTRGVRPGLDRAFSSDPLDPRRDLELDAAEDRLRAEGLIK